MNGYLILETGEVYTGQFHGNLSRAGEVVFNTSHSGYEEIATDPSYLSQIVVMTAPMQGNYGVDRNFWESRRLWIEGFVCLQAQNSVRDHAWRSRLAENQIPLLSEVDTRSIAMRLRSGGTPWGALVTAKNESDAKKIAHDLIVEKRKMDGDWVYLASRKETEVREGQAKGGPRVVVLDFGCKENILRELQRLCSQLIVLSSRATEEEILKWKPDALMLTNGPGDPSQVQKAPETVKKFIGKLPIFGICMGHQILALALGAKTYKLKFGHRGSNHPIKDVLLNMTYMTSQNHGYAVEGESLPPDARITQVNLNDNTVAGYYSQNRCYLGIQYHPESHPGPHDAAGLFDFFIRRMVMKKG